MRPQSCALTRAGPLAECRRNIRRHGGGIGRARTCTVILAHARRGHGRVAAGKPHAFRSCFRLRGDPVAPAYVDSLARPGGNATGFARLNSACSGESGWKCYKQIAPRRDANCGPSSIPIWAASTQPSCASCQSRWHRRIRVEVTPVSMRRRQRDRARPSQTFSRSPQRRSDRDGRRGGAAVIAN